MVIFRLTPNLVEIAQICRLLPQRHFSHMRVAMINQVPSVALHLVQCRVHSHCHDSEGRLIAACVIMCWNDKNAPIFHARVCVCVCVLSHIHE
jgi:hypothetical protein